MSKKRPSNLLSAVLESGGFAERTKEATDYWFRRLFKNTFTYKGNLVETRKWSVKIQFQGRRKTFSLASIDRAKAAAEALEIYSALLQGGWSRVEGAKPSAAIDTSRADASCLADARQAPAFWKPRLIVRKYTESLSPRLRRELSVRIEHQGTSHYFPLGTEDADMGAIQAVDIYQTAVSKGWHYANLVYPREFTVGIFWATNPFACTYTTLYTIPATQRETGRDFADSPKPPSGLLIVEEDGTIRRALSFWVRSGAGVQRVRACESAEMASRMVTEDLPAWLLVNQDLPGGRELLDRLRETKPGLIAFTYGVFEGSDAIFASVTGVSRGYMLRRRPPSLLFEPILRVLQSATPSADEAARHIRLHFQNLFDPAADNEERQNPVSLTRREQEILDFLSQGYLDKEIATNLGISAWTVHSHLKRIYEKLRVHTRTEAVVKYLQK